MGKLRRVVFFQNNAQVFGNGLVAVEMLGHVEFRQIGDVEFLGVMSTPSNGFGQGHIANQRTKRRAGSYRLEG